MGLLYNLIKYSGSNKLEIILDEINSGKRKKLHDIIFSCEELLTKDADGITFLEKILNKGFDINWQTKENIKNNIEIAYIYFKCNEKDYFFELKEDDLFLVIDGKTYLEYFFNKYFYLHKIDKIENHIEIIDILINTNNIYYFKDINSKIKSLLIEKTSNGEYKIEKYFKNKELAKKVIVLISSPSIFLELSDKYSNFELLEDANETILMTKMIDGRYFIEYLINDRRIIPNKLKNLSSNNIEFINFILEKDLFEYIEEISNETLNIKINDDKTFLDYLIDEVDEIKFRDKISFIYSKETISILIKKERLDLVSNISDICLLEPLNVYYNIKISNKNYTLLEYMLDNGYNPLNKKIYIHDQDILRILYLKNRIDLILKISPSLILKKIDESSNITYLEYILECIEKNEIGIKDLGKLYSPITNSKEYYISINRIDIVKKIESLENDEIRNIYKDNPELLLDNPLVLLKKIDESSDITYLDYILKNIFNKTMKINLNIYANYYTNLNDKATYYVIVARNDMLDYLKKLDTDMLLKKEESVTLLEILLEKDKELTLNKILTSSVKANFKIAAILWNKGIEIDSVNIVDGTNNFSSDYLKGYNNHLGIGPLKEEGELLLERLEKIFIEDGGSNKELISLLINSYRNFLFLDYELGIKELNKIVLAKEKNYEKFLYNIGVESGFSTHTGDIICKDLAIETMAHETGHALHWYLSSGKIPNDYDEIVSTLRCNKDLLNSVDSFIKNFNEIKEEIINKIESKCEEFFKIYYTDDKKCDIRVFLEKEKQEKIEELLKLGLSYDKIISFLEMFYTEDNYIINQKKQIFIEHYGAIMGCKFSATIAILDILDAIYEGALFSGKLKNEEGKKIKSPSGHGLSYYYMNNFGFIEMIADFITIMKSEDSCCMLEVLRSIVGEELYNMLNEFYYINILGIDKKNKSTR